MLARFPIPVQASVLKRFRELAPRYQGLASAQSSQPQ